MKNLTEMLATYRTPDGEMLLRAAGIDESHLSGDASDYEKLVSLVASLPLLAGHPLYRRITLRILEAVGTDRMISTATVPALWRMCAKRNGFPFADEDARDAETDGESRETGQPGSSPAVFIPRSLCVMPGGLIRSAAVSLSDGAKQTDGHSCLSLWTENLERTVGERIRQAGASCTGIGMRFPFAGPFVPPNPYTSARSLTAWTDLLKQDCTVPVPDALLSQSVRVLGQWAGKRGCCLVWIGGNGDTRTEETVIAAIRYLSDRVGFSDVVWIPDRMEDESFSRFLSSFYAFPTSARPRVGIRLTPEDTGTDMAGKLTAFSSRMPIGQAVLLCPDETHCPGFSARLAEAADICLRNWEADGTAPSDPAGQADFRRHLTDSAVIMQDTDTP